MAAWALAVAVLACGGVSTGESRAHFEQRYGPPCRELVEPDGTRALEYCMRRGMLGSVVQPKCGAEKGCEYWWYVPNAEGEVLSGDVTSYARWP